MKRRFSYENGPTCYLVATPIGNLGDFSKRAIEVLNTVSYIACEDTRTSSALLHHFTIKKPLISYHEHNEQECSSKLISLLKEGHDIAIISDAGYPGISDPGHIIVEHCIKENISVSVIPGPNAFLPALIASGLDNEHFYFHGFLSSKPSHRKKELEKLSNIPVTLIFYESPHRIMDTLNDLNTHLNGRKMCLARELTKKFEEFIYGSTDELITLDPTTLKGEMVLIVEGKKDDETLTDDELIALLKQEINNGASLKDASKTVSLKTGIKKNAIYSLALKIK